MIPGPKSRALSRRLRKVESRNITYLSKDFPVFWESARGCAVRDVDGNTFLDLTGAFAVSSLGHTPPAVQKAIAAQTKKIWHGMGDVHPSAVKVELLERLAQLCPGNLSTTILSSSGAEAVESALKTARLYTGKAGVIAFEGAYHGLSYGTLPVTYRKDFKEPFADQLARYTVHVPYPDSLRGPDEEECLERVERILRGGVGAILVEPVQGRGGVRVPKPFFLKGLREIATRCGILLIADEIFTGFGRTGKRFGVDHSGVIPDLMCLGKAMANGFPISACVGSSRVMAAWPSSNGEAIHTSTFLGSPLGCAMALASLKELESRSLASRAAHLGEEWKKLLAAAIGGHPKVAEIRGLGLMIGIELVTDRKSLRPDPKAAWQVVSKCLKRGLLVLSGGDHRNVLTLTPPLVISLEELRKATKLIQQTLSEL